MEVDEERVGGARMELVRKEDEARVKAGGTGCEEEVLVEEDGV